MLITWFIIGKEFENTKGYVLGVSQWNVIWLVSQILSMPKEANEASVGFDSKDLSYLKQWRDYCKDQHRAVVETITIWKSTKQELLHW